MQLNLKRKKHKEREDQTHLCCIKCEILKLTNLLQDQNKTTKI